MDVETPKNVKLTAFYKRSYAHYTIKDRLPVILTKIIDHLVRYRDTVLAEHAPDGSEALKDVIGEISKLKYELQTNKELLKLVSTADDVVIWNKYLEEADDVPTYFNIPWLYAETYIYRRLKDILDVTPFTNLDLFRQMKYDSFTTATQTIIGVSTFLQGKLEHLPTNCEKLFAQLVKLSLWGNRCDLSVSVSLGATSQPADDMLQVLESFNDAILVNDIDIIWDILNKFNSTGCVTIITDNSGYELFTDLCLADFLITAKLADYVVFDVKSIPWFISDVTPHDFHWFIDQMYKSNYDSLSQLGKRWKNYLTSEKWRLESNQFWTLPFGYAEMKSRDVQLYNKLRNSKLLIFKGDLNYRKLLGDVNWEYTQSFKECLQDFHPTNLCSLRTNKADLICGLSEEVVERFKGQSSEWLTSGEHGIIQCYSTID